VNNTLDATAGVWAIQVAAGNGEGFTIFNNVLLGASGAIGMSGAPPAGFWSDYNVVSNNFSQDLGASRFSLSQWKTRTGQDQHSVSASAREVFVSPSGGNYQLRSGSSALDVGTDSFSGKKAPGTDREGNNRPLGAKFDAGAHESPVQRRP
jgi:hypothetical protein